MMSKSYSFSIKEKLFNQMSLEEHSNSFNFNGYVKAQIYHNLILASAYLLNIKILMIMKLEIN